MKTPKLDAATLRKLAKWHKKRGWECQAHSEGQECCIDMLVEKRDEPLRVTRYQ